MDLIEIKAQRRIFALSMHANSAANAMKTLPWPPIGSKCQHTISVPTWLWDDVEDSWDPQLITTEIEVTLRTLPDFGIISYKGEMIGRY